MAYWLQALAIPATWLHGCLQEIQGVAAAAYYLAQRFRSPLDLHGMCLIGSLGVRFSACIRNIALRRNKGGLLKPCPSLTRDDVIIKT